MRRIPHTQIVVARESEIQEIIVTLEKATAVSVGLLKDWMSAEAKVREYSNLLVQQSIASEQIMQINLLLSGALGRVREGEDIERVVSDLESQLQEFGGDEA